MSVGMLTVFCICMCKLLQIRRQLEEAGFSYRDVRMARHKDTGEQCSYVLFYAVLVVV